MAADELGVAPERDRDRDRTDGPDPERRLHGRQRVDQLRRPDAALGGLCAAAPDPRGGGRRLSAPMEGLDFGGGEILRDGAPTGLTMAEIVGGLDLGVPVADIARPKAALGTLAALPRHPAHGSSRAARRRAIRPRHDGVGMLHGAPVHPPHMDWPLVELDLDALRARPGVVEVVRDGSFVGILAETPRAAARAAEWARANGTWGGNGRGRRSLEVIARSEAEAAVVAETGETNRNDGRWFETTVTRPFLFHGSIGPAAAVAQWEGEDVQSGPTARASSSCAAAIVARARAAREPHPRDPPRGGAGATATTARTTRPSTRC